MNIWKAEENHIAFRWKLWYNFHKQAVVNLKHMEKENEGQWKT